MPLESSAMNVAPLLIVVGIVVVFVVVIAVLATLIVKGVAQWRRNNAAPVLTVPAVVMAKRTDVSGGGSQQRAHTSYYVTFETPDGRRLELPMSGGQFGGMSEGDEGQLTVQGTRYHGFERSLFGSR